MERILREITAILYDQPAKYGVLKTGLTKPGRSSPALPRCRYSRPGTMRL